MVITAVADPEEPLGPICPHCRASLRDTLRQEEIAPHADVADEPPRRVMVVYCGSCGTTLDVSPARTLPPEGFRAIAGIQSLHTVKPADDPTSLDGRFHERCRSMIEEILALGFTPGIWIAAINAQGGAPAARKLLANGRLLAATPWLVERGRSELTLEHEIAQPEWSELFTDAERAEAARRLAIAGDTSG